MKELTGINYVNQFIHGGESSEYRSMNSNDYSTISQYINSTTNNPTNSLVSLIVLAICLFNVYLSWTCNSAQKVETIPKVIYAFFAFSFGIFYTLYYFFVRAGTCKINI